MLTENLPKSLTFPSSFVTILLWYSASAQILKSVTNTEKEILLRKTWLRYCRERTRKCRNSANLSCGTTVAPQWYLHLLDCHPTAILMRATPFQCWQQCICVRFITRANVRRLETEIYVLKETY